MRMRLLITSLLLGATTACRAGEVALHRSNPGGVRAGAVPVTVGIPFAVGQLPDEKAVALVDAAGRLVPCQASATSRWWSRGGSVQTLLLSFVGDPAQDRYTLRFCPRG